MRRLLTIFVLCLGLVIAGCSCQQGDATTCTFFCPLPNINCTLTKIRCSDNMTVTESIRTGSAGLTIIRDCKQITGNTCGCN